jgi:hypothetical protein
MHRLLTKMQLLVLFVGCQLCRAVADGQRVPTVVWVLRTRLCELHRGYTAIRKIEVVATQRALFNARTAVGTRVASGVDGPKARNGRGVYAKTLAHARTMQRRGGARKVSRTSRQVHARSRGRARGGEDVGSGADRSPTLCGGEVVLAKDRATAGASEERSGIVRSGQAREGVLHGRAGKRQRMRRNYREDIGRGRQVMAGPGVGGEACVERPSE